MSEYLSGVTYEKPSRKNAKKMDKICREEGGYGFIEVNVQAGSEPGINHGRYQGWFRGPNLGSPFDKHLARCVKARVERECV